MEIEIGACYRDPSDSAIRRVLDLNGSNLLATALDPGSNPVFWITSDFAATFTERVPDPTPAVVEEDPESDPIALMDNGLAPDGWVEVQRDDNHQDVMPSDEAAAIALAGPLAMLYRVATGEMAQCLDEEACDVLAARVNDTEDGTPAPALVCIVPRSVAVEKYGEENVPR
jgi:hypothetical protein